MTHHRILHTHELSSPSGVLASATLNQHLESVINWRNYWLITFIKIRLTCCLCPAQDHPLFQPYLWNIHVCRTPWCLSVRFDICSNLNWFKYISGTAKVGCQHLAHLFRALRYLPPATMLYLNKATIRPAMEYCCHIWAGVSPAKEGQMVSIH